MDLEKIMQDITCGLSGDSTNDIKYLQNQCEKYKDHKLGKEIIRACGRLIYELLPDDQKAELNHIIHNDKKAIEATIKEIRFNVFEENIDKAFEISEALVAKIEKSPMFQNDTVSEYFDFNDLFEKILYIHHNSPKKDLRDSTIPYSEIFYIHGNLLFELNRISEARVYLEKSLHWNPVSCTVAFEYIETFKVEKDLNKFYELTKEQFKYAYKPEHVARCFRNLGFYFVEIKEYSVAAACYFISMFYDSDNKMAQSELYYIQNITQDRNAPTVDLLIQYEKEYGIPQGADRDAIGLAYAYGQKALEDGHKDLAIYFLEIFCGLAYDDATEKLLEQLKNEIQ